MRVNVLLFATLKDRAGANKVTIELPDGATISDARSALAAAYPALAAHLPTAIAALNQEFAEPTDLIQIGD
ncbi:MAG: hypothetical protein CUN53_15355, partial [Phototrophicales bacterium]